MVVSDRFWKVSNRPESSNNDGWNQSGWVYIIDGILSSKRDGAEEAHRAHNPRVGGSKPPLATSLLFFFVLLLNILFLSYFNTFISSSHRKTMLGHTLLLHWKLQRKRDSSSRRWYSWLHMVRYYHILCRFDTWFGSSQQHHVKPGFGSKGDRDITISIISNSIPLRRSRKGNHQEGF